MLPVQAISCGATRVRLSAAKQGRGEMQLDIGMFFDKPLHLSRFVNGEIVQDDVYFLDVGLI